MLQSTAKLIALVALTVFFAGVTAEELYSNEFDELDVPKLLADDAIREEYYNCIMGTGPCTNPAEKFFAGIFPEMITTKCQKCTDVQKKNLEMATTWFTEHQPDKWTALVEKANEMMKNKGS